MEILTVLGLLAPNRKCVKGQIRFAGAFQGLLAKLNQSHLDSLLEPGGCFNRLPFRLAHLVVQEKVWDQPQKQIGPLGTKIGPSYSVFDYKFRVMLTFYFFKGHNPKNPNDL